jgi:hypothetical protein
MKQAAAEWRVLENKNIDPFNPLLPTCKRKEDIKKKTYENRQPWKGTKA